MFSPWMLSQESAVEGQRVAVALGLQRLLDRIQSRGRHNPPLLHHSPLHKPFNSRKAASGEA